MDVKGGHIAVRRSDGHLILRETAQTPPADQRYFNDAAIHPFAHCNTLWFNLAVLDTTLRRTRGQLDLPLIRNVKTVDPTDPSSPAVIQLESAMGAAIEHFPGALAVAVPRSRFIPVKTTNELCLLRSDVFDLGDDWIPRATVAPLPVIDLDRAHYSAITDFDHRLPHPLALRPAHHLVVEGDWTFGAKVQIAGDVRLPPPGGQIPDGAQLGDQGTA
jgi:UTP--glucose-1-phosphate uridylyltransferase